MFKFIAGSLLGSGLTIYCLYRAMVYGDLVIGKRKSDDDEFIVINRDKVYEVR